MGFLSYGSGKALSYTHDFQKDIDRLYQRESYRSQVQAEKEKKSMFYASLMKEETAVAPVNIRKLETFYEGLHKDVADFAINNPDWETDVTKTQHMRGIMDQFINNSIIREDQQGQQQWNATKESYNKKDISKEEYEQMADKYNKYKDGVETDPYVFANPKRKELSEIIKEGNDWLKPQPDTTIDPKTGKEIILPNIQKDPVTGERREITKVPEGNYYLAAKMHLTDKDTDFVVSQAYDSLPAADKGLYKTKVEYLAMLYKAGETIDVKNIGLSDNDLITLKARAKGHEDLVGYYSFFDHNIGETLKQNKKTSSDERNVYFTEFGGLKQRLKSGPSGRMFKVYQKDDVIGDINIDGSIYSLGAGSIIDKGGVPWVEVHTLVKTNKPDDRNIDYTGMTEEQKVEARKKDTEQSMIDQVTNEKQIQNLLKNGFKVTKVSDPGLLRSMGVEGSTVVQDVYEGTVLMPADFSEGNRNKYNVSYGTKEKIDAGLSYEEQTQFTIRAIKNNDVAVVSSIINNKERGNIAIQLNRKVDDMFWTKDPDNPTIWYAEDGENLLKYNFETGKLDK